MTPPRYAHLPLLLGPDGRKLSKRHGAASVQELRTRGTCRRQSTTTSRCSAPGSRPTRSTSRSRNWPSASASSGSRRTLPCSTSASCATSTACWIRELGVDELTRRLEELTGRTGCTTRSRSPRRRSRRSPSSGRCADSCSTGRSTIQGVREDDRTQRRRRALGPPRDALAQPSGSTPTRSKRRCGRSSSDRGSKPGQVFQPVRVAIAGTTVSPGIFESVALLGRDETLARIDRALKRASS